MKICPNCKKENNDSVSFCNACGTPLQNEATPVTQAQSPAPKKSKALIFAMISLVAIVVILAIVVVILAGKLNSEKANDTTPPKADTTLEAIVDGNASEDNKNAQQTKAPEEGIYYINNDSTQFSKIELKNGEAFLYFNLMEGYCVGKAKYTISGNTVTLDHVTAYSFTFDGQTTYMDKSPDAAIVLNPGSILTLNNHILSPQNLETTWVYEGWGLPYDFFCGSQFYKAQ